MTPGDMAPPPAERRPAPRSRVLLSGIVAYGDGAYSLDCTIRNLSKTGARVTTKQVQLPSDFFLINLKTRRAQLIYDDDSELKDLNELFPNLIPFPDGKKPDGH